MNIKNKILNKWSFFLSWILSLLGITIGVHGCVAYGPPDNYEQIMQLKDLEQEVIELERKADNEKWNVMKMKATNEDLKKGIEKMNREKDSINILLQNFEE